MNTGLRKVIIIGIPGLRAIPRPSTPSRANLNPLMFEGRVRGGIPGGQLMITNDVENYPGFPEKVAGPALMAAFRAQAAHQGAEIRTEDVNKVDLSRRPFRVWAGDDNDEYTADALIIATGAQAKWLDIPSEHALKGKGVSACAVCDGAFFRNQDVIVVGGGDTAMEESMYLSGICRTVTIVHRREEFRASKTMRDRVLKNPKVRVLYNSAVDEVLDVAKGEMTGARIRHVRSKETMEVTATGLFVAIGHTLRTPTSSSGSSSSTTTAATFAPSPGTTQTSVDGRPSPPGTFRTSFIARQSPLRAPAAWRRWKWSGGSR